MVFVVAEPKKLSPLLLCRRMRNISMYVVENNFIGDQFTKLLKNSRRRWLIFFTIFGKEFTIYDYFGTHK